MCRRRCELILEITVILVGFQVRIILRNGDAAALAILLLDRPGL
jgi:hypothetical protein